MKKRYIIAIGLMLIIYMSACGNYINAGVTDNKIYLYGLIDFLIISVIMIAVPFFLKMSNKLNDENGKKICVNNSLIIFILSILATIMSEGTNNFGIGGLGAIFYYFINMNLFVQETNQITSSKKNIKNSTPFITNENNNDNGTWQEHLKKNYKSTGTRTNMQELMSSQNIKTNDNLIEENDNTLSNTNYKNIFIFTTTVLAIALIISLICNLYQYSNNKELTEQYNDSESKVNEYVSLYTKEQIKRISLTNKSDFLDKHIVFIIDGYGNYYYTYDCMKEVTSGKSYSFLAYNTETAIAKGYKKFNCSN